MAKYANGRLKSDAVMEAENVMLQSGGGMSHHKAAQALRRAYILDCDNPTEAAIEWSNDADATVDTAGDLWVHGHWATEEEMEQFIDWLQA